MQPLHPKNHPIKFSSWSADNLHNPMIHQNQRPSLLATSQPLCQKSDQDFEKVTLQPSFNDKKSINRDTITSVRIIDRCTKVQGKETVYYYLTLYNGAKRKEEAVWENFYGEKNPLIKNQRNRFQKELGRKARKQLIAKEKQKSQNIQAKHDPTENSIDWYKLKNSSDFSKKKGKKEIKQEKKESKIKQGQGTKLQSIPKIKGQKSQLNQKAKYVFKSQQKSPKKQRNHLKCESGFQSESSSSLLNNISSRKSETRDFQNDISQLQQSRFSIPEKSIHKGSHQFQSEFSPEQKDHAIIEQIKAKNGKNIDRSQIKSVKIIDRYQCSVDFDQKQKTAHKTKSKTKPFYYYKTLYNGCEEDQAVWETFRNEKNPLILKQRKRFNDKQIHDRNNNERMKKKIQLQDNHKGQFLLLQFKEDNQQSIIIKTSYIKILQSNRNPKKHNKQTMYRIIWFKDQPENSSRWYKFTKQDHKTVLLYRAKRNFFQKRHDVNKVSKRSGPKRQKPKEQFSNDNHEMDQLYFSDDYTIMQEDADKVTKRSKLKRQMPQEQFSNHEMNQLYFSDEDTVMQEGKAESYKTKLAQFDDDIMDFSQNQWRDTEANFGQLEKSDEKQQESAFPNHIQENKSKKQQSLLPQQRFQSEYYQQMVHQPQQQSTQSPKPTVLQQQQQISKTGFQLQPYPLQDQYQKSSQQSQSGTSSNRSNDITVYCTGSNSSISRIAECIFQQQVIHDHDQGKTIHELIEKYEFVKKELQQQQQSQNEAKSKLSDNDKVNCVKEQNNRQICEQQETFNSHNRLMEDKPKQEQDISFVQIKAESVIDQKQKPILAFQIEGQQEEMNGW